MLRAGRAPISAVMVLALGTSAWADAELETSKKLQGLLIGGKTAEAQALLDADGFADKLGAKPELLRSVCTSAWASSEALGKSDTKKAMALTTRLVESATKSWEAHDDDARCAWALAHAFVARGRAWRAGGAKPNVRTEEEGPAADWAYAADALLKCPGAKKDDGRAYTAALEFLLDAPMDDRRSNSLVLNRLVLVSKAQTQYHGKNYDLALHFAKAYFGLAQGDLFKKQASTKELLRATFDALRPFTKNPDEEVAELHYDAVTMQVERKIVLKERFLTSLEGSLEGAIVFDVPLSKNWFMRSATSKVSRQVVERDDDGTVVRAVRFALFDFAPLYVFESGEKVGGDNPKGIANLQMEHMEDLIEVETKRKKPRKGKVNKRYSGYYGWIEGEDSAGKAVKLHLYVFRGKGQTCAVLVVDHVPGRKFSPALEAVLHSVREYGRR